jgi:hypothetical protein
MGMRPTLYHFYGDFFQDWTLSSVFSFFYLCIVYCHRSREGMSIGISHVTINDREGSQGRGGLYRNEGKSREHHVTTHGSEGQTTKLTRFF